MDKALIVKYQYHDADVVELHLAAWNGRFGGQTNLYVGRDELENVGETINNFPNGPTDTREIILGAFGNKFAGGAASLQLSCRDRAGHAQIRLSIEADYMNDLTAEMVILIAEIEPAAVDRFVPELISIGTNLHGYAILSFL